MFAWTIVFAMLAAPVTGERIVLAQADVTLKPGATTAEVAVPVTGPAPSAVRIELQFDRPSTGAQIAVTTPDGGLLGSIAPFGERKVGAPQTYTIPLSDKDARDALAGASLKLRLELRDGDPSRSVVIRSVETVGSR